MNRSELQTDQPDTASLANWLSQRDLIAPVLLFIGGNRPLSFAAGQLLHLAAPTAALLGFDNCRRWAELLSDPHGMTRMEKALEDASRSDTTRDL